MPPADILERRIAKFDVPSGSVSVVADGLRKIGYRVCSFEDLDMAGGESNVMPFTLNDMRLRDLLDEIVRLNPAYTWEKVDDDIINIFPKNSVLDTKVPAIRIKGKALVRALVEDLGLEDKGIYLFNELSQAGGPVIDMRLKESSLREILNKIIQECGRVAWHISGRPGAYFLTLTDVAKHEGLPS